RKASNLPPRLIAEEIYCFFGSAITLACKQVAHVSALAAQPNETGLLIERVLKLLQAESIPAHEIEQHAWVNVAAAGSHRQTRQRGKTHRGLDAAPAFERAHGRAGAQMRRHDPLSGQIDT